MEILQFSFFFKPRSTRICFLKLCEDTQTISSHTSTISDQFHSLKNNSGQNYPLGGRAYFDIFRAYTTPTPPSTYDYRECECTITMT